ncbi:MAG: L-threonylcarbamoyladenylate synthase [Maricaulaceae bacterium]|jgi:L-threonylcarbamoyladenylate synthase
MIEVLAPDEGAVARAAETLAAGGLVGLPTETVYGLAARADSDEAVARLYAVKDRPRFNPLIVHAADASAARALVKPTPLFDRLAEAFWPGALTLVADRAEGAKVSALAAAGLDTLAVRVPGHPVTRDVIARLGLPIVMPSANRSGRLSPTRAADVARDLGDMVDLILDGGTCAAGVESTVIDARGETPVLLRAGALSRVEIEAVAGPLGAPSGEDPDRPASPGQLAAHYAPRRARLRLNAAAPAKGEAFLAFGATPFAELNLSVSGNLVEAAARLFSCLRALDDAGYPAIAVAPVPNEGLGEAINDRLARAATCDSSSPTGEVSAQPTEGDCPTA